MKNHIAPTSPFAAAGVALLSSLSAIPALADTTYSTLTCTCGLNNSPQGARAIAGSTDVYICGTLTGSDTGIASGFLYRGPLQGGGAEGTWAQLNFTAPGVSDVTVTSPYGPADGPGDMVTLVGVYQAKATGSRNIGCMYRGPDSGTGGTWTVINPPAANYNNCFPHSTMGRLVVGNFDIVNVATGFAFVYDIETGHSWNLHAPGATSTTAYGIWHDGGDIYTIAGGYSILKPTEISQAFICRWNAATHTASDFRSFSAHNQPVTSVITHFEGITGNESGGYNFAADWINVADGGLGASLVHVARRPDGSLGEAVWLDLAFPGAEITSANSVVRTSVVGIYGGGGSGDEAFIATVSPSTTCAADLNGDGVVDGEDLTAVLASWGACSSGP